MRRHQPSSQLATTLGLNSFFARGPARDLFKQEALLRVAGILRPGGIFYLWDAIFGFDPADAAVELQAWVDAARNTASFTPEEFATHIREEHSTYDWIIAGMLQRARLEVIDHHTATPTHAEFLCRRPYSCATSRDFDGSSLAM